MEWKGCLGLSLIIVKGLKHKVEKFDISSYRQCKATEGHAVF